MRALLQKGARASRLFLTDPNENLINVNQTKDGRSGFWPVIRNLGDLDLGDLDLGCFLGFKSCLDLGCFLLSY